MIDLLAKFDIPSPQPPAEIVGFVNLAAKRPEGPEQTAAWVSSLSTWISVQEASSPGFLKQFGFPIMAFSKDLPAQVAERVVSPFLPPEGQEPTEPEMNVLRVASERHEIRDNGIFEKILQSDSFDELSRKMIFNKNILFDESKVKALVFNRVSSEGGKIVRQKERVSLIVHSGKNITKASTFFEIN